MGLERWVTTYPGYVLRTGTELANLRCASPDKPVYGLSKCTVGTMGMYADPNTKTVCITLSGKTAGQWIQFN